MVVLLYKDFLFVSHKVADKSEMELAEQIPPKYEKQ